MQRNAPWFVWDTPRRFFSMTTFLQVIVSKGSELDHPVSRGQVAGSAVQPAWQNVFNRSGWCGQPVGGS